MSSSTASTSFEGFLTAKQALDNRNVFTTLSELPTIKHGRHINVLVVVLGPREDRRRKRKQDYYTQDATSIVVGGRRRKTVVSVWLRRDGKLDLLDDEGMRPGTIIAIYGASAHKLFEEDPMNQILVRQRFEVLHGHLNIFHDHPGGWYAIEPEDAPGYATLAGWRDNERIKWENELERKRTREEREKLRSEREVEARELEVERQMAERERLGEVEAQRQLELQQEMELQELLEGETMGLVWVNSSGKKLWKFTGMY